MKLKVNISGLRFRAGDGKLNVAKQLKILNRRLSNPVAVRIRAGDKFGRFTKYITQRKPIGVKVTKIELPPVDVFQIKIPEMVQIAVGKFKMGSTKYEHEGPVVENVEISAFAIGKYEVTNEEYKVYLAATVQEVPELVADPAKARHPVVQVSWHAAVAYVKWINEVTGRKFRLPTEAEGEYAAQGPKGRRYPWGNNWAPSRVTRDADGTRPVNAHPKGVSPFGVMDLSGNVWEWRADWYSNKYNPKDLVNPKGPEYAQNKVMRGGAWFLDKSDHFRSASRSYFHPWSSNHYIGFRVAEDL